MKKEEDFAEILKEYKYEIQEGDIVAGKILYYEKTGFLVEIGSKRSGYLPNEEIYIRCDDENDNNIKILFLNTVRDFFLVTQNLQNKQYILSLRRLDYIRAWKRIKQLYTEDITFNLKINSINKGGIITYLEGIQGFIPKSHLLINSYNKGIKSTFIHCRLLNLNENKNQLILSNRSAQLVKLKHKFKLGELLYGKITVIRTYGIFIDIYTIKALLHSSEIQFRNLKMPLKIGKFIKIKIIYLNIKQGLVSVSTKSVKQNTIHHLLY
uniref:Ribosomal protein S1 n=1 Tax=Tolypiocladia glomerulata TaxID=860646 RepID=A0A1Z1MVB5_9FLOR|nr:ribosomal protein S1 [Tolypiocladia glomerulata]ARW69832.1 ribosomal protein S1 [Tolypiocladia glomerulata]